MKRALTWSTSLLLMFLATGAVADETSTLIGKYGLTGTVVCNQASGAVTTGTVHGTVTFHSDGTGTRTSINHLSTAGSIGSAVDAEIDDTFKYSVNGGGGWTEAIDPGSFKQTFLTGPNAGVTCTTDQVATQTGFVGIYAQTLTTVTDEAVVETTTCSNNTVGKRICQRTQVLIKQHD